ncbi:DNA-binding transcriptional ArsR family regulator [Fontibacillus solani]|uniref:DNA-binding transcriptional ArsR family regulator n=1 Tax=Fontibacillus solani TaxID=1572857 RepID=A0A7W3SSD5_9BACL|nr:winged helix-turn-helix domain-containing protein [Fontibacillus solani]MBA9085331.1 DNA-binding transcriptional ArsR family regulator [Fontibacillus solani]
MDNSDCRPRSSNLMQITREQAKLLESALRIKILNTLSEESRTSKQVADLLNKTPGNIHYHIQKLYDGGLLELVKTHAVGGVTEKYYRAKSTTFKQPDLPQFLFTRDTPMFDISTRLLLSEDQLEQFKHDFIALINKWEAMNTDTNGLEYGVSFQMGRVMDEDPGH